MWVKHSDQVFLVLDIRNSRKMWNAFVVHILLVAGDREVCGGTWGMYGKYLFDQLVMILS